VSHPINEPWEGREQHREPVIYDCKGLRVFTTNRYAHDRIIACVNACQGLSNEMLAAVNSGDFQLVVTVKGDPTKVLSAITPLTSDQHVANTSGGETAGDK
jgi:hypothetical protein